MKALLIEDDAETAENICSTLTHYGYEMELCGSGLEGLERARHSNFDALIVDRLLPTLDGLNLVRQLRVEGNLVPILFVTALDGIDDRVAGLNAGGDDYLVKPFAFNELVARVNALTRRKVGEQAVLRVQDLEVDRIRRTVVRGGSIITLQPIEFDLLVYLMRNAGYPVTRAMLLENVWNLNFDPQTNIVESHMCRLRGKIDRGYHVELIKTVRGRGYILGDEQFGKD
jgi:two-component system, OmpR family, response regulator